MMTISTVARLQRCGSCRPPVFESRRAGRRARRRIETWQVVRNVYDPMELEMIPLERNKPRGNNHEKILAFFLAFSYHLRQYLQTESMFNSSSIRQIIIIASIYTVIGCSQISNEPGIARVVTQHDSENEVPVVSNKKIVCPTNGHLYPCIVTSVKTPISPGPRSGPGFPVSPVPASIMSATTPGMTNVAPPESATAAPQAQSVSDAEYEAIALDLRDLTATLGPLLTDMTDARPEPHTAAGPEHEPVPPSPPGPDDATARDRAPGPDPHPSISDHQQPAPMPSPAAASLIDPEPAAGSHSEPQAWNTDEAPSTLSEKQFSPGGQAYDPVSSPSSPTTPQPGNSAPTRTLLASVYFPFNSVSLVPSEKIILIDLLAQVRGKRLLFVGFTDRLGDKDTNVLLAYRRARAVKTFFLNTGLGPANLFAAAKGHCCYKNDGKTPTGRQQNRRVEIYETTENFQPRPLTSE